MKAVRNTLLCLTGAALLTGLVPLGADVKENPFQTIVERNVFGLKDPPAPPPPVAPPSETKPQTIVELTGITSIFAKKKALLEITEPGPGKTPKKPIMEEGDRVDSVEVLFIDVDKGQVRIRNAGVESNLTFKVVKSAPAPAAPGAPAPAPGILPHPASAGAIINPAGAPPGGYGGGVTIAGGAATVPSASPVAPAAVSGGNPNLPFYGASTTTGRAPLDPGLRAIPSRSIRTPAGTPQPPIVDPAHQYLNLIKEEADAQKRGIIFPPTPPVQ